MSEAELPKRQRCTKRIVTRTSVDENLSPEIPNSDFQADDFNLLYTNAVASHWNSRTRTVGNLSEKSRHTESVIIVDKEPLREGRNKSSTGTDYVKVTSVIKSRQLLRSDGASDSTNGHESYFKEPKEVQDPTPPPSPDIKSTHSSLGPTKNKMRKSIETAIGKLEKIRNTIDRPSINHSEDCQVVESFSCDAGFKPSNSTQKTTVKIRSLKMGTVKYEMSRDGFFSEVVSYLASIENVSPQNVTIFLRDSKLKEYETPASVNLGIADIIECYVRSGCDSTAGVDSELSSSVSNEKSIKLYVQCGTKSKMSINIKPEEPMLKLMNDFCTAQRLRRDEVCFMFDGETIDSMSTPQSLDLEDGFCIDAVIYNKID